MKRKLKEKNRVLWGEGYLTFAFLSLTFHSDYPIHQIVQIWIRKAKKIAEGSLQPTTAKEYTFSDTEEHFEFFRICTFDVNIKRKFLRKNIWHQKTTGHAMLQGSEKLTYKIQSEQTFVKWVISLYVFTNDQIFTDSNYPYL